MPRGELVGEAYVRIHADTTFMRRAIKRAAKEDAENYTHDFSKRIEQVADSELKGARDRLTRAVALQDFSGFEKQFGSVERAVKHVQQEMEVLLKTNRVYSKDVDVIRNSLNKWAIPAQAREDLDHMHEAAIKMQREMDLQEGSARRLNKQYDLQVQLGERLAEANDKLELHRLTSDFEYLTTSVQRDNRERDRAIGVMHRHGIEIDDVARALVRQHSAAGRLLTRTQALNDKFEHFGAITGRAFGKGSRNNFFNFVGSAVGGLTTLALKLGTLIGPISKVGGVIGDMIDQFKVLRASGGGLGEALAGALGTGLKAGVAGLAALAASAAILVVLLPLVAAGFSLLAGAMVAIVGAITIGVVGALLPLVPLLGAVGAGVGALLLGLSNLGKKVKGSKDLLAELKKEFSGLQKAMKPVARESVTEFTEWVGLLRDAVPFLNDMARSTLSFFKRLREGLKSKEMKPFLDQFAGVLPIIADNISQGLSQLSQGLVKFFAPISDWGEILSGKFEDLTTRFNKWAGSAKGQNSIKDFMKTAWDAASDLWDILTNITSIIGTVFNVGTVEGGGQSFLDYLVDITDKFDKFLKSPEGKTQIQDWFTQVKQFMKDGKDTLESLAKTFDELDTEEARAALLTIVDAVVKIANAITAFTGFMNAAQPFLNLIAHPSTVAASSLALVAHGFEVLMTAADTATSALRTGWLNLQVGALTMALVLVTQFGVIMNATLLWVETTIQAAAKAFGWVPGLGPKLQAAAGNVSDFRRSANASLDAIKKDLEIQVHTLNAQLAVEALKAKINSIKDKSVVITAIGRFANEGVLSNGGTGKGGGRTFARGTIARRATQGIFGEAGAEALVPLDRPLSQVDPSVRWLSAIAQGKHYAGGGMFGGGGLSVAPGAIVVQSVGNPQHVAMAILDRITAAAN